MNSTFIEEIYVNINFREIVQSTVDFHYDEPEEDDTSKQPQEDNELLDQVATPPKALMNKVQTIKELSTNARFNIPNAKESGIDLNLLTQALSSKDQVVEVDEEWQFDSLFVRVTGELQAEAEAEEEVKREEEEEEPEESVSSQK